MCGKKCDAPRYDGSATLAELSRLEGGSSLLKYKLNALPSSLLPVELVAVVRKHELELGVSLTLNHQLDGSTEATQQAGNGLNLRTRNKTCRGQIAKLHSCEGLASRKLHRTLTYTHAHALNSLAMVNRFHCQQPLAATTI